MLLGKVLQVIEKLLWLVTLHVLQVLNKLLAILGFGRLLIHSVSAHGVIATERHAPWWWLNGRWSKSEEFTKQLLFSF